MRTYVTERLAEIGPGQIQYVGAQVGVVRNPRYFIRVTGPNCDTQVSIDCVEDFEILQQFVEYVKRRISVPAPIVAAPDTESDSPPHP